MSVTAALESALGGVDTTTADTAVVALARTYAAAIDNSDDDLAKLGPQLLATLAALGMTPAARKAVGKGVGNGDTPASPLDELRDRRARRAANLDTAAAGTHT